MQGHMEDKAKSVEATLEFINGGPTPVDSTDNQKRNRKSKSSKTVRKTDNHTSSSPTVINTNGSEEDEEDERKLEESNAVLEQTEETLQSIKSITTAPINAVNGSAKVNSAGSIQHSSSDDMDFIEDSEFKEVNRKKKSKENRMDKHKVANNSNNYNKNSDHRPKPANSSVVNKPSQRTNDNKAAHLPVTNVSPAALPVAAPSFDLNSFPVLDVRSARRTSLGDLKTSLESAPATDDERDSVKSQPQATNSSNKPIQSWANVAANPTNNKKHTVSAVGSGRPETEKKLSDDCNAAPEPQASAPSQPDLISSTYTETYTNVQSTDNPATKSQPAVDTDAEPPPYLSPYAAPSVHSSLNAAVSTVPSSTPVTMSYAAASATQQSSINMTNISCTQSGNASISQAKSIVHDSKPASTSAKTSHQGPHFITTFTRAPSIEFGTVTTGDDTDTNKQVKDILSLKTDTQINQRQAKPMPKSRSSYSAPSMLKHSSKMNPIPRNSKPVIFLDKESNQDHEIDFKITFGYGSDEVSSAPSAMTSLSNIEMTQSYPGPPTTFSTTYYPTMDEMSRSMIEPSYNYNHMPDMSTQKANRNSKFTRTNSRDGHRGRGRYQSYHKGFDHSSIAQMLIGGK